MKRSAACLFAAAALFLFAIVPSAQQQQSPPILRSGIELVTVDVTVLNRGGEPLTGLGIQDFTLTVDGSPRRVVALRLVRGDSDSPSRSASTNPPAGTATEPGQAGRLFVFVVDRDHIAAGEGRQALDAGGRFLDALPPNDRAAVWAIPPTKAGLQFSSDRESLKQELRQAVGTYRAPMLGGVPGRGQFNIGREEALEITDGRRDVLAMVQDRECPKFDPAHPSCPSDVEIAAKTVATDWHQRAQATLTALDSLVRALGPVEGPKQLVLMTAGPVNTQEELGLINGITAQAAASRVTIHALQVSEGPYQARTDHMRAFSAQIDQTLSAAYFLAGSTGGLAITPVSGDIGFGQLARELSASYELAFETTASDRDGALHKIAVQVRDAGWASVVRARKMFRIDPAAALAARPAADRQAPADQPASPPDPPAAAPEPLGVEVSELTSRLSDYVEQFEREFSAVVAEERYVQMIHPWRGNPKGPEFEPMLAWREGKSDKQGGPVIARRQILSDILMVQTRGQQWVAFRDVATVDGKQVRDRSDRVRDLFLSRGATALAQLREITEESSRYNLGNVRRTLNIPTLTLSFMRRADQWRYQFKRQRDESIDERPHRVVSFVEKARPTLIGTPNSGDIPIEGRIWMDAETGRVARTELRFDRGGEKRVLIRVDYASEPALDVLVPAQMWEWYEGADQLGRIGGDKTLLQGLATYSSLRRFQVSTSEDIKRE